MSVCVVSTVHRPLCAIHRPLCTVRYCPSTAPTVAPGLYRRCCTHAHVCVRVIITLVSINLNIAHRQHTCVLRLVYVCSVARVPIFHRDTFYFSFKDSITLASPISPRLSKLIAAMSVMICTMLSMCIYTYGYNRI